MGRVFAAIAAAWCCAVFYFGFGIVHQLMTVDGISPLNTASGLTITFVAIWLVSSTLLSFIGVICVLALYRMIEG
ncbi:MAG: hypothetical protein HUU31_14480 [Anaerolineae bacterium]|nr:hypothetical protein [Anaerolineae bacterium]